MRGAAHSKLNGWRAQIGLVVAGRLHFAHGCQRCADALSYTCTTAAFACLPGLPIKGCFAATPCPSHLLHAGGCGRTRPSMPPAVRSRTLPRQASSCRAPAGWDGCALVCPPPGGSMLANSSKSSATQPAKQLGCASSWIASQQRGSPSQPYQCTHADCVLEPGQMLFIPPGWWHYVKSTTVSFSVSFWWR